MKGKAAEDKNLISASFLLQFLTVELIESLLIFKKLKILR